MVEEHGVDDGGAGRVRFGVTHGSLNPGSRAADDAADPDNADPPVAAPDTNLGSIRRDDRACRAGTRGRVRVHLEDLRARVAVPDARGTVH